MYTASWNKHIRRACYAQRSWSQSGGQIGNGISLYPTEIVFPLLVSGFAGWRSWPRVAKDAARRARAMQIFFIDKLPFFFELDFSPTAHRPYHTEIGGRSLMKVERRSRACCTLWQPVALRTASSRERRTEHASTCEFVQAT